MLSASDLNTCRLYFPFINIGHNVKFFKDFLDFRVGKVLGFFFFIKKVHTLHLITDVFQFLPYLNHKHVDEIAYYHKIG